MLTSGVVKNIEILTTHAQEGIATAPTDVDNLVRKIPLLLRTPDGYVPAFGTEVLKSLVNAKTYVIKTNELGIEEIRVKGLPPVNFNFSPSVLSGEVTLSADSKFPVDGLNINLISFLIARLFYLLNFFAFVFFGPVCNLNIYPNLQLPF